MIRFALCDDEPFMLEALGQRLSKYVEEHKLLSRISRFDSGQRLLECDEPFDVVFLDIQMESPDGMETARRLRARGFRGVLIFITVLKESVFDSFEVQAFDYLIKPLDDCRFRRTVERAVKNVEQNAGKSILVQKGNACQIVLFSQIVFCEVIGRKIYLHCQSGEVIDYYNRLDELQQHLDGRFFRCHRSYLVNLDYVREFHSGLVGLSDGDRVPISRLREQEFTSALLTHMKERRR